MIEAKNVNYGDIKAFADDFAKKGFKADRDINELELRLELVSVIVRVDRKYNHDFKQIRGVVRLNFTDYVTRGFAHVYEAKAFKGLSHIYVDELISVAKKTEEAFRVAIAAASSHVASIDPKRIMQQETEHVSG